jgi:hypothetical protein
MGQWAVVYKIAIDIDSYEKFIRIVALFSHGVEEYKQIINTYSFLYCESRVNRANADAFFKSQNDFAYWLFTHYEDGYRDMEGCEEGYPTD